MNRLGFKRTIGSLVVAGVMIPASGLRAEDCLISTSGALTIRATPKAASNAIGTLAAGQTLPMVASISRWYETRVKETKGFVAKRGVQITACPAGDATEALAGGATFEIHAIDVGTGLSVLVHGKDFNLLYDAGSNDDTALEDKNRTLAYLKWIGVTKLDHVILSHPHRDHVELMPDVINAFKPGDVWNSGAYNDICGYRNLLLALEANASVRYHTATQDENAVESIKMGAKECYSKPQPERTLKLKHAARITTDTDKDKRIPLGDQAFMTFLRADGSRQDSFNDNSLVMKLDLGDRSVLFMGDAEAGGRKPPSAVPAAIEGDLLECCRDQLKSDVLIVGHHGSKTSSRSEFVKAIGAKTFIVSAGPTKYATVVLPDEEIISELEGLGKVFRTDLNDGTCGKSQEKVGPRADDQPGGCDNILVTIRPAKPVRVEYRHP